MKLYVARWVATCSWLGLSPVAPGTLGTVMAAATFYLMRVFGAPLQSMAVLGVVFFIAGLWASDIVSAALKQHDPACIVIDEWVAMWLLCLAIPHQLKWYLLATLLFRLFDIAKPWPISQAEQLPGAWGIMADDLVAAGIAGICLVGANSFGLL